MEPEKIEKIDAAQLKESSETASIEIRDKEIDVEHIMAKIRRNIEEKKRLHIYQDEPWLSQSVDIVNLGITARKISDHLALLRIAAKIGIEGEPITSHRPILGPIIKTAKKISRYFIRKYTDPIFYKQNHFNAEVINTLTELNTELEQLKQRFSELEKSRHTKL